MRRFQYMVKLGQIGAAGTNQKEDTLSMRKKIQMHSIGLKSPQDFRNWMT